MSGHLWITYAGATAGLIGALTGGLSLWRQFRRDRVSLRLVPIVFERWNWTDNEGRQLSSERESVAGLEENCEGVQRDVRLEIVNLAAFPITIESAGFLLKRSLRRPFVHPRVVEGHFKLCRVESRDSVNVRFTLLAKGFRDWNRVRAAFARTACGSVFTGTSRAFTRYCRMRGQMR